MYEKDTLQSSPSEESTSAILKTEDLFLEEESTFYPKVTFAKRYRFLIGFLLFIALIFSIRACTRMAFWDTEFYRIARDSTWYPLDLLGKAQNVFAFSNELLFAIAKEEEMEFELLLSPSEKLFHGLDSGEYDGILSAITPTIGHQKQYLFSESFFRLGQVLVIASHSTVKSIQDMEGKILGIRTGASLSFNIEKFPSIILRSYDNDIQAFSDVERGLSDGFIMSYLLAQAYISGPYAGKFRISDTFLTEESLRLVTRNDSDSEELINSFNEGLETLKSDGRYQEFLKKWQLSQI